MGQQRNPTDGMAKQPQVCSPALLTAGVAECAGVAAAAGNGKFPSVKAARYSYTRAVHLGLIFFESMRSGKLDRQRLAWCAAGSGCSFGENGAECRHERCRHLTQSTTSPRCLLAVILVPQQSRSVSRRAQLSCVLLTRRACLHRRRSDSCTKCRGPSGEDLSQGYYEAGGSFLKLGLVESFLVRRRPTPQRRGRVNSRQDEQLPWCQYSGCGVQLASAARQPSISTSAD